MDVMDGMEEEGKKEDKKKRNDNWEKFLTERPGLCT